MKSRNLTPVRKLSEKIENQGKKLLFVFSLLCLLLSEYFLIYLYPVNAEIFELGKIVITATRFPVLLKDAPGSVTVISQEEIRDSEANNVSELLQKIAGVEVRSYGFSGMSTLSVRGSSANQVLVMIDGRPVNLASTGSVDLSGYPLDDVERIEIARGPFSALYGSGALGGVVNIVTKNPPDASKTEAKLSFGSYDMNSYTLSHGSKSGKTGYFFTIRGFDFGGDRENNWKKSSYLSGEVIYPLSSVSFTFSGGYSQEKKGIPGSEDFPSPRATEKDERNWLNLKCNWTRGKSDFSLNFFCSQDETLYQNPDWNQKDTTRNERQGAVFQHNFSTSKHNFIWGIDWNEDQVDVRTADGTSRIGGKRQVSSGALFLQDEVEISPRTLLFLGARYDQHSVYGCRVNPRISIIHRFGKLTSFKMSWGTAFRSPSVNDLYWQEDWGWGMGLFGNPELEPEVSSQYEIGMETFLTPKILTRVTCFSSRVNDLISWIETQPWRWEAQNVDKASIKGLEGEVKFKPLKKLQLSFNYTYLEAKDEKEYPGKLLPYRSRDKFFLGLDWMITSKLRLFLESQMVGERFADRENTEKLPSYTLLGARLRYVVGKKIEFFFKADNLLDEEYEDIKGYPMPGRTIKAGIKINL